MSLNNIKKEGDMLPTTTKITKEMILNTAFEIAREKGFEKISNRELAKKMNCSIRPIYYQFKNVEELNKELYKKIERYFYEFMQNSGSHHFSECRMAGSFCRLYAEYLSGNQ